MNRVLAVIHVSQFNPVSEHLNLKTMGFSKTHYVKKILMDGWFPSKEADIGSRIVVFKFAKIFSKYSTGGLYAKPIALTSAKQIGHLWLHRFVTSIATVDGVVCNLCHMTYNPENRLADR